MSRPPTTPLKPRGGRRIFVGDIQGCCQELDDLLHEVSFEPGVDVLYSVGDVVNRGPASAECLRRLMEINAVVVAGNHERHLMQCWFGHRRSQGRDTLQDVLQAQDAEALIEWTQHLPILIVDDDIAMVHAGIHPHWYELEAQKSTLQSLWSETHRDAQEASKPLSSALKFAISARLCDSRGHLAPKGEFDQDVYRPWDAFYQGSHRVIFGHWAQRGLVHQTHVIGLDSGCVYGKQLSAWIAEEDRIVQVKARKAYCPI